MAKLPPVKLETHTTWFNLLLTVLHEHAESNPYEEYRQMAQKLIVKCMAYGTPFTDGYGASCVDLRMYPSEAGDTIWHGPHQDAQKSNSTGLSDCNTSAS